MVEMVNSLCGHIAQGLWLPQSRLHHVSLRDGLELFKKSGVRTPGCGRGLEPTDILGETMTRILPCKALELQNGKNPT